jgi:hypothetical protein
MVRVANRVFLPRAFQLLTSQGNHHHFTFFICNTDSTRQVCTCLCIVLIQVWVGMHVCLYMCDVHIVCTCVCMRVHVCACAHVHTCRCMCSTTLKLEISAIMGSKAFSSVATCCRTSWHCATYEPTCDCAMCELTCDCATCEPTCDCAMCELTCDCAMCVLTCNVRARERGRSALFSPPPWGDIDNALFFTCQFCVSPCKCSVINPLPPAIALYPVCLPQYWALVSPLWLHSNMPPHCWVLRCMDLWVHHPG